MSHRPSERRGRFARVLRAGRRLSLYLVVPALGAVAPLIAIPAITGRFGASGWAVVAVAISIGSTAAVVGDLGWGTVGPQAIARDPLGADDVYRSSLGSKSVALLFLLPAAVLLAAVLSPADPLSAILIAAGTLLTVLSPSWLFIGRGRPDLIMWTDTVPRLVLSSAAALAIAAGAPLITYGFGTLLGALATFLLASRVGRLPGSPDRASLLGAPTVLRRQLPLIVGNIVSTVFTSAPASILAYSVTPSTIATYSAVDRPMRMGLNVLGGIPARLQSWVGTPDAAEARRRSRISILANLVLGAVAAVGFFLLAPPVTTVLFSGSVRVDAPLAALGGLIAGEICFSRGLGLAMVASDRANSISVAVSVGAALGVALLVLLPPHLGAAGALIAIVVAEGSMIVVQLLQLRAAWAPHRGRYRSRGLGLER